MTLCLEVCGNFRKCESERRSLKLICRFLSSCTKRSFGQRAVLSKETLSRTKHSCRVPAQLDTQSLGTFEGKKKNKKNNNSDDVIIFYRTIPKVSDLLDSEYF